MKNRSGFTLIELLAVIIVLAILSLVATPAINKIIKGSRQDVFESSVEGMIRTVVLDTNNTNYEGDTYTVIDGSIQNSKGKPIYTSGGTDENGTIIVDGDGRTRVAVYNKKWCALKGSNQKKLEVTSYKSDKCKMPTT